MHGERETLCAANVGSVTSLIGRIARRQIVPRSARAKNPKDSVQHRACVLSRSPSPIGSSFGAKQRFENRPLGVGKVHAFGLRRLPYVSTAQRLECAYEIT